MNFSIVDEFRIVGRGTVVLLSIDKSTWDAERDMRDIRMKATHLVHEGKVYEIKGRESLGPSFTGCLDGTPLDPASYALLIDGNQPKGQFKTGDLATLLAAAEDFPGERQRWIASYLTGLR